MAESLTSIQLNGLLLAFVYSLFFAVVLDFWKQGLTM